MTIWLPFLKKISRIPGWLFSTTRTLKSSGHDGFWWGIYNHANHFSSVHNVAFFWMLLIFCWVFTSLASWYVWAWSLMIYSGVPWTCNFMTFNKFVKWSAIYFFKYVFIHCYHSFAGRSMTWVVSQIHRSVHFLKSELLQPRLLPVLEREPTTWERGLCPGEQGLLRRTNDFGRERCCWLNKQGSQWREMFIGRKIHSPKSGGRAVLSSEKWWSVFWASAPCLLLPLGRPHRDGRIGSSRRQEESLQLLTFLHFTSNHQTHTILPVEPLLTMSPTHHKTPDISSVSSHQPPSSPPIQAPLLSLVHASLHLQETLL